MQSLLVTRAAQTPDRLAYVEGNFSLTYAQLAALTAQVVLGWKSVGIQSGSRIGLLLNSGLDMLLCIHAALHTGAVIVPINTRLTAAEVSQQLALLDCRVVLYHASTRAVAHDVQQSHNAYYVPYFYHPERMTDVLPEAEIRLEMPCVVISTSGTSGFPKGALLTLGALYANAIASGDRLGVAQHDRWLCVLPLYHVGGLGMVVRAVVDGTTLDLLTKFDAATICAYLHRHPITLISLVPTMLYRLLETCTPDQPPQSLRLVLLGGAAPTLELLDRAYAAGFPVATTYGLSEAASQVATALPELARRKIGTVGKPLAGLTVQIVDADGQPLPAHREGEVLVRGATIMQGYLNNPTATEVALRAGWLHTGDIGYLDDDGDLFILQRRSDLIVSGGENVYPAEVEKVLREHPAVRDAMVVALPDAEWGQAVGAVVTLVAPVTVQELNAYCRDRLAGYKQPRHLLIVEQLPLTHNGKPQRSRAVEMLMPVVI